MKLVRLFKDYDATTTIGKEANFNNNFQAELVLAPQSQIALLNVAIDTINPAFTVDINNSTINWSITDEDEVYRDFTIASGTYTSNDTVALVNSLRNGFNSSTGFLNENTSLLLDYYLGVEWDITGADPSDPQLQIEYNIGNLYWIEPSKLSMGTFVVRQADGSNFSFYLGDDGGGGGDDYASGSFAQSMISKNYISRGCGCVRSQITKISANGTLDVNSNGFILGLTTSSTVQPSGLSLTDIKYGIHYTITDAEAPEYYVILDGIRYGPATLTPTYLLDSAANDVSEVMINNGKILFNIYQDVSQEPQELNADGGLGLPAGGVVNYTAGQKLYPVSVFHSGIDYMEVRNIIATESPENSNPSPTPANPTFSHARQPDRTETGENIIEFQTTEIAEYLGFDGVEQGTYDSGPGGTARGFNWVAQKKFNPLYFNDNFLVELRNIALESYDGLKEARKNVLAFISKDDSSGQFNYEVNTPIFIDLHNKKEVLLRNIEADLLYGDYSKLAIQSDASMTLLIKEKGE